MSHWLASYSREISVSHSVKAIFYSLVSDLPALGECTERGYDRHRHGAVVPRVVTAHLCRQMSCYQECVADMLCRLYFYLFIFSIMEPVTLVRLYISGSYRPITRRAI